MPVGNKGKKCNDVISNSNNISWINTLFEER